MKSSGSMAEGRTIIFTILGFIYSAFVTGEDRVFNFVYIHSLSEIGHGGHGHAYQMRIYQGQKCNHTRLSSSSPNRSLQASSMVRKCSFRDVIPTM